MCDVCVCGCVRYHGYDELSFSHEGAQVGYGLEEDSPDSRPDRDDWDDRDDRDDGDGAQQIGKAATWHHACVWAVLRWHHLPRGGEAELIISHATPQHEYNRVGTLRPFMFDGHGLCVLLFQEQRCSYTYRCLESFRLFRLYCSQPHTGPRIP